MNRFQQNFFGTLLTVAVCLVMSQPVLAQWQPGTPGQASSRNDGSMPRDLRDVFERLLDDLSPAVAERFQTALDENTPDVEFTPEEFKAFRANPANPFESLDRIDADKLDGTLVLHFEIPSLRQRPNHPLERQHASTLNVVRPLVSQAAASTVSIFSADQQQAVGVIVRQDGMILTKASEIAELENPIVQFSNGRSLRGRLVRVDERNDVALLEVKARNLQPVTWSDAQPLTGAFVVTPASNGDVYSLGTYSVIPSSTVEGETAFLGVRPENRPEGQGVSMFDIRAGTAASVAGLQDGDIMLTFDGSPINSVTDLFRAVKLKTPGDAVLIDFIRNGVRSNTTAMLAGRDVSGERAQEFKMMNRLGAIPSKRNTNFPMVFLHDSPLFPEQIGGPVLDLEGRVIGMNISRSGRTGCYAIPSAHVKTILNDLLRENLAQRRDDRG